MLIGIGIKNNNKYYYSKPLFIDTINNNKDYFYGMLFKDIDYSLILKYDQEINLNIVKYKNNTSYNKLNLDESNSDEIEIIGSYNLMFNNFKNRYEVNEYKRESFKNILDENYDLEIEFSVISTKKLVRNNKDNTYILSLPILKGKKIFFE